MFFSADSILVNASDITFNKDTGANTGYTLHFSAGFRPYANLTSTTIDFLDLSNSVTATLGNFDFKKDIKGFYYLESASHYILMMRDGFIDVVLSVPTINYINYDKIRIAYVSTSGVAEVFSFSIH